MNVAIHHILSRRSIRSYTTQPLNRLDLKLIVQCGQYAPSAMGEQPCHFSIITQREILDAFSQASKEQILNNPKMPEKLRQEAAAEDYDAFWGAPFAVIVSAPEKAPYAQADCTAAVTAMAIAAQSMEIGSCIVALPHTASQGEQGEALRQLAHIPEGHIPHFALALGRAAENPAAAPRREGAISYL